MKKAHFIKTTVLKDTLAVRCAEFNPKGNLYAVGSNSRNVYICQSSSNTNISSETEPEDANIIKTFSRHHKGSIYCLSWSPDGRVLATGSNDKTIKLTNVAEVCDSEDNLEDVPHTTLTFHDGTVRDCAWMPGGQTLVSAGAGDDQIFLADCNTGQVVQVRSGHVGHVMCVGTWQDSHMFVSGGQDGHVLFWDIRSGQSVQKVKYQGIKKGTKDKSSSWTVNSVSVDPTGRLLVSAGEDGGCDLFDIRGERLLQTLDVHHGEVRCARLCPPATHLMSVGYDGKLVLTDIQGDITEKRTSITVARHRDKVVNIRWHPEDCCLISCSADKTAAIWKLNE